MRTISQKRLKEFWTKHRRAEEPLRAWYKVAIKEDWRNLADVRSVYNKADQVGSCLVFNIEGNSYRLIVRILYDWTLLLVCTVLTHREYDRESWKTTCRCFGEN
jgi:mRNA interferase HigB